MILSEIKHMTTIFCDLDGVLVNFEKKAFEVTGIPTNILATDSKLKKEFWTRIKNHIADGNMFFEDMDLLSDALILWKYIERYSPTILSATGKIPNAENSKRKWVQTHLGSKMASAALFVHETADKRNYVTNSSCILIDDRTKAIDPWIKTGGIGIHHTSAANTINELKVLGL